MTKHNVERRHAIPGQPPSSIWTAYQIEKGGNTLVVCVGVDAAILKLTRKLRRNISRSPLNLPCSLVRTRNKSGVELDLMALYVGKWGSFEQAKEVVLDISGKAGDGPAQWSRRVRQTVRAYPNNILPSDFVLEQELVVDLCKVYLSECRRMTTN